MDISLFSASDPCEPVGLDEVYTALPMRVSGEQGENTDLLWGTVRFLFGSDGFGDGQSGSLGCVRGFEGGTVFSRLPVFRHAGENTLEYAPIEPLGFGTWIRQRNPQLIRLDPFPEKSYVQKICQHSLVAKHKKKTKLHATTVNHDSR